jgi:hypothetical protein
MIPFRSRSDSWTFTFEQRAIGIETNFSRCPDAVLRQIGIDHAVVGILAHAMQSMAIPGFIAHNRQRADSGHAALTAILEDAGLK